jgi:hypothetical protein
MLRGGLPIFGSIAGAWKNKMNSKDHETISTEAYKMFEPLLVGYYEKSYEESYQLLRNKIEGRLRGKDTNSRYRQMLFDNLEDLILTVIFRLISINSRSLLEKGERIRDLPAMVNRITDFVYYEELRAIRKRLGDQPVDGNDSENTFPPIPQPVDNEIQAIKNEMILQCYEACMKRLSADNKAVFRAYYPAVILDPKTLAARRKRLASEEAGMMQEQSGSRTPEEEGRILNNLQSKVNKLRKTHVEDCVKACVESNAAQDPRLNYLEEQ